jgi:hypothetical protein
MKTKYVFLFDRYGYDNPAGVPPCCIFDNFIDASSFFLSKGCYLNIYSDDTLFSVKNDAKVVWQGSIYEGKYF